LPDLWEHVHELWGNVHELSWIELKPDTTDYEIKL